MILRLTLKLVQGMILRMTWNECACAALRGLTFLVAMVGAMSCALSARAAGGESKLQVQLAIITHEKPAPALYELDPRPQDEGVQGARLAIEENNTTGAFTGQRFDLDEVVLGEKQSPVDAARRLVDKGVKLLVLDLPADELLAVADALKGGDAILFNVQAEDDRLRGTDCRANLFHLAPSRAMLTDALMQFLTVKRWSRLFLIAGPQADDQLYAAALKNSAKKFGLKIVAERPWKYGALARARSDSVTQADALDLTRGVDYDMMIVADEAGDFGDYIPYHSWDPKLLAGTQGLIAATWHQAHGAWGAEQLQNRFRRQAGRWMRPVDYQAWMAVRAIGEAATSVGTADPAALRQNLLSPDFGFAAFKGIAVSFRPWDRQLRQPLLLAQPNFLVAAAPQPGFLHQRTPLDTLGVDQPESTCHAQ
jgi:ABC transporter substrate binding protein (PQQ-dependent alcohol dehydrogenase system)